ncbi:MAG: hypothetical protein V1667_01220 [bacterium]
MKKIIVFILTVAMVFPALANAQICGMDGNNYASSEQAETAGTDASYGFACVNPSSETGLYEAQKEVNFAGALIEIGSTDIPTNLIIRDNKTQTDYTVSITADTILGQRKDQATSLSDWIPGDQIKITGKKNENTGNIAASMAINASIKINSHAAANGWITKIDKETKTITYQWANKEHSFKYDDNSKFAAGLKNPASVDDLAVNDRIRARLLLRAGQDPMAKIVIVLRRNAALFMKIRTFTPRGTLVRMDNVIAPATIQIKIEKTPGLKANDVNNIIGSEGSLATINITENTQIVRKYFGKASLSELSIGDDLLIVGRVNDDGTVDAKLVKDNSIWKTSTQGHAGIVAEISAAENYLMLDWTPVKELTKNQLKEKLKQSDQKVSAQTANTANLRQSAKEKIKAVVKEKIGNIERIIKQKKIQIAAITHQGVKIGDLIKRQPKKTIKVVITDKTKIIIGANTGASLSDIKTGDKARIRGVKNANSDSITADTIMIVSSLPEIEESLSAPINDINEVVSVIETTGETSIISNNAESATEEEVSTETTETTNNIEGTIPENTEITNEEGAG